MLSSAGAQIPVAPLFEIIGSCAKGSPSQMSATAVNVGSVFWITVMVRFAGFAHCPPSGVNVYSVVIVLSRAGLQAPVIPLLEVVGSCAKGSPSQMSATALKLESTNGLTVMVFVAVVAHCPAVGVNV